MYDESSGETPDENFKKKVYILDYFLILNDIGICITSITTNN